MEQQRTFCAAQRCITCDKFIGGFAVAVVPVHPGLQYFGDNLELLGPFGRLQQESIDGFNRFLFPKICFFGFGALHA